MAKNFDTPSGGGAWERTENEINSIWIIGPLLLGIGKMAMDTLVASSNMIDHWTGKVRSKVRNVVPSLQTA